MFLQTTADDHRQALEYARQSVDYTYNRMRISSTTQRASNIYLGKLIEEPVCRVLETAYGITVNRGAVETRYTQSDRGDMLLAFQGSRTQTGDIKSFRSQESIADREEMATTIAAQAYALIPNDQVSRIPKDIYIFTNVVLAERIDPDSQITVTSAPALLTYPRWAPLSEVRQWECLPAGSFVYPYLARGTRVANRCRQFNELHSLDALGQYLTGR